MINIIVWSNVNLDIENKSYEIGGQADMVIFLRDLLDKIHYSGETICLESAKIDINLGKAIFTEIDRWK